MTPRRKKQVRYISPFGSPAWMQEEEAERHLAADDKRWMKMMELEAAGAGKMVSDHQRQIGPPHIERH